MTNSIGYFISMGAAWSRSLGERGRVVALGVVLVAALAAPVQAECTWLAGSDTFTTQPSDCNLVLGRNLTVGLDLSVVGNLTLTAHGNLTLPFGKLGIGTVPTQPLDVVGNVNVSGNILLPDSLSKLGIGTTSPTQALDVVGNVNVSGNIAAKYQDVAEWVPAREELPAGTVVVISANTPESVESSSHGYDTGVAGVVSAQPGIALGERGVGKLLVAHSGRVKVKVDAKYGAVRLGDLLVTSATPGYAMLSEPVEVSGVLLHRPGTVLGKALEPLMSEQGEILVLLTLQ